MSDKALHIGDAEEMAVEDLPEPSPARLHQIDPASCRNRQRGMFAGAGLKAYADRVGNGSESLETVAGDFLGDLMHLCDATSMDFEHLVFRAGFHYDAEIGGEG